MFSVKEQESGESTESPVSQTSLVPRFTKAGSEEDENYMPDLCLTNYDTLQVINDKIFVFEEEVCARDSFLTSISLLGIHSLYSLARVKHCISIIPFSPVDPDRDRDNIFEKLYLFHEYLLIANRKGSCKRKA